MARYRRSARRDGAVAVEFAIVLVLVLIPMILGVWEVGRLVEAQQTLSNAAREGGRQASTGQRSAAQVQDAVVQYLARFGYSATAADVTLANLTDGSRSDPRAGTLPGQALQMDHFRITVDLPMDRAKLVTASLRYFQGSKLRGQAEWYSMNDIPLVVTPTIPPKPS